MKKNQSEPIIADDIEYKMPTAAGTPEADRPSPLGLILAAIIVILVLLLGGLYIWSTTLPETAVEPESLRPTAEENNEPESTNAEAEVETAQALSTSDELSTIEADLESTNTATLDSELTTIDQELEANAE